MGGAGTTDWASRFDEAPMGPDKVLPLGEAIRRAVEPGATLHFAFAHNRASAAMAELLRQFRGTSPGFTLAHMFTAGPAVALLTEGLVAHLITTLVCEPYPAPAPSRPTQRAASAGQFTIEHWSVLSYIARLEAAARGLPFLPVRSLLGSTLADENQDQLRVHPTDETVEVAALTPDVSFVHAPCADRFGNTLLAPPLGEGTWGALAAKRGVVVTAERLVEPEVIRRHSHLPAIPSSHVRSVSVVPFGAHPAGLATAGIEGVEPYGDDVAFYGVGREAGRTDGAWRAWVDEWLTQTTSHDDYLGRVGAERLLWLKGKARPDSWRSELLTAQRALSGPRAPTATERMIVAAADLIAHKVEASEHRSVLSGMGAANLAAWLAHAQLDHAASSCALVAEVGMYGYAPRPCDAFLFNFRNLATCTLAAGSQASLGLFVGGAQARCLGSLGAGQVDATGAFNSTRLGDGTLLVGSGGANDVASTADEVVITIPASRSRLVEQLPYVTAPGTRVTAVVTDRGIFEKPRGAERLRLTRLVGAGDVRALRDAAGFSFEVADDLDVVPEPTAESLERLHLFDPSRSFLGPTNA